MTNSNFYYYKSRGQSLGPFDLAQIQQRAKRAQINQRSEVSIDGYSWQPAQNFPEIFAVSTAAPPVAAQAGPVSVPAGEVADWFYMANGEQQGPVSETAIIDMVRLGNLTQADHVWKDGMVDWKAMGEVPALAAAFAPSAPVQHVVPQTAGMARGPMGVGPQVFCTSCGQSIPQQAAVCVHCGVPNKGGAAGSKEVKSRTTAAILALFVGGFGAHKFYTGHTVLGILYLLFCVTLVPAFVALIEAILYLCCKDDEQFTEKYCVS